LGGIAERHDDYGQGRLRLIRDEDGDMSVSIISPDGTMSAGLTFVSRMHGGGRSPETLEALRELHKAMLRDEQEYPSHPR